MLTGSRTLTVGQLTEYITQTIQGDPALSDVTVAGELSNFVHHSSGHMYFTLKDKDSCIKGVMFRTWNQRLLFKPEHGQQVFVRGDVVVYKRGGNYQLNVHSMEPAGQGALALAFAQLKEKLAAQGLFDQDRKLPLPRLPKIVGLVTAPQGAALQDFLVTAGQLGWPVKIELVPAIVQGVHGAASVVAAIKQLNRRGVDVIVLTRGGGSLEELWVFNEEAVARAVADSKVPIVSAIGHETDFTICDFVASQRAATPTAAAKLVVPDCQAVLLDLENKNRHLRYLVERTVQRRRERLEALAKRPVLARPLQILHGPRQSLDIVHYKFKHQFKDLLGRRRQELNGIAARLTDLNPMAVLSRGFSVVRHQKGIIKSVTELKPGQEVTIQLHDGQAKATVNPGGK